jgi:hypothetical protein
MGVFYQGDWRHGGTRPEAAVGQRYRYRRPADRLINIIHKHSYINSSEKIVDTL